MNRLSTIIWRAAGGAVVVFMVGPLFVLALFAFSDKTLLSFPITGLTFDWWIKVFNNPAFWAAFKKSIIVTSLVGLVSTIVGTMAANALAQKPKRVAGLSMALVTLPVMLPPLVLAVALANYYSALGIKF